MVWYTEEKDRAALSAAHNLGRSFEMKQLTEQADLLKKEIYMDVLREVCWLSSATLLDKRANVRVPAQ